MRNVMRLVILGQVKSDSNGRGRYSKSSAIFLPPSAPVYYLRIKAARALIADKTDKALIIGPRRAAVIDALGGLQWYSLNADGTKLDGCRFGSDFMAGDMFPAKYVENPTLIDRKFMEIVWDEEIPF